MLVQSIYYWHVRFVENTTLCEKDCNNSLFHHIIMYCEYVVVDFQWDIFDAICVLKCSSMTSYQKNLKTSDKKHMKISLNNVTSC